jgi:hypothetical protein
MAAARVQVGHAEAQKGLDPGAHHRGAVTAIHANAAVVGIGLDRGSLVEPPLRAGICRGVWNHQR